MRIPHALRRRTTPESAVNNEPRSILRLALIMVSSAMLGGVTVALWNRKAVQELRQAVLEATPESEPAEHI